MNTMPVIQKSAISILRNLQLVFSISICDSILFIIGNGKLICASIYCGPNYDFGNGPRIWIDNLDSSEGTINYFKDYFENDSIKKVFYSSFKNYSTFCFHRSGTIIHLIITSCQITIFFAKDLQETLCTWQDSMTPHE